VGIGIPIPVLDEDIAATLALTDEDLTATVFDYGVQRRSRPALAKVTYAQLRSGSIEVEGKMVPTGPISALPKPGEQGFKPLEIRTEEAI
jgi:uncharacterized protein (DUF39 family)